MRTPDVHRHRKHHITLQSMMPNIPGSSQWAKFVPTFYQKKKRPKGRNLTYLEDPAFPHLGYHHPQFSALFAHILQSHLVRFLRARSNGTGSLIRATRATDTVNHLNQLTSSIFRGPNCSFQGEGIFMEKIMRKKVEKEGCK